MDGAAAAYMDVLAAVPATDLYGRATVGTSVGPRALMTHGYQRKRGAAVPAG
jgi:hypothetical protein